MRTFAKQFLLALLMAFTFQFGQRSEASALLCQQLFGQNASLETVLSSNHGNELITRPEVSKLYEAELTQILMTEKLDDMTHLRDGQGHTYKAKIRKYRLEVIVKRYESYAEINDSYSKNRAAEERIYDQENLQKLKNETAAWKVSRATGMDVFPFGVIREIRNQLYWVQLFVNVKVNAQAVIYKNKTIEDISNSPSGVRDYLLSYLLGDLDHGGNSLYHLTENRQFYIDAGSAFLIGLNPTVRKTRNLDDVHPFVLYGKNLSKEQVLQDVEFFKAFIELNAKDISKEINDQFPNDDARIDFELKILKVQQQIKNIVMSL